MLMAMAVESGFVGKFSGELLGKKSSGLSKKNPDPRHFSFDDPRITSASCSRRSSVPRKPWHHSVVCLAAASSSTTSSERARLAEAVSKLELAENVAQETYVQILRACRELKALEEGRRVHAHISKRGFDRDLYLRYCLILMYLKCRGDGLADARRLFFSTPQKDVILWTEMIAAHARSGQGEAAMEIYHRMRVQGMTPNRVTFIMLLKACSAPEMLAHGKVLHSRILEQKLLDNTDRVLCNVLLRMYLECGSVGDARKVFESMERRDIVSWTTMAQAETETGKEKESVRLFRRIMLEGMKPDRVACIVLLNSCAALRDLSVSRWAHACVSESGYRGDPEVGACLINVFGKCGSFGEAREVFDEFRHPGTVFWTTMIAVCAQNKRREAMELFNGMLLEGIRPDAMTFATIMNTCAGFTLLREGKRVRGLILESGMDSDTVVSNSVVTMLGSCGELVEARGLFDGMVARREAGTWNSMITGYARHGKPDEALELFTRMKQLGESPDDITYVGVFSACAHGGFLEEACRSFGEMREFYGVEPTLQHYGCIVDVLGRSGWIAEAEEVIRSMPFAGDAAIWTSLCSACKRLGDLERGRRAAENVVRLEPENTGMLEFFRAGMYSSGREASALSGETEVDEAPVVISGGNAGESGGSLSDAVDDSMPEEDATPEIDIDLEDEKLDDEAFSSTDLEMLPVEEDGSATKLEMLPIEEDGSAGEMKLGITNTAGIENQDVEPSGDESDDQQVAQAVSSEEDETMDAARVEKDQGLNGAASEVEVEAHEASDKDLAGSNSVAAGDDSFKVLHPEEDEASSVDVEESPEKTGVISPCVYCLSDAVERLGDSMPEEDATPEVGIDSKDEKLDEEACSSTKLEMLRVEEDGSAEEMKLGIANTFSGIGMTNEQEKAQVVEPSSEDQQVVQESAIFEEADVVQVEKDQALNGAASEVEVEEHEPVEQALEAEETLAGSNSAAAGDESFKVLHAEEDEASDDVEESPEKTGVISHGVSPADARDEDLTRGDEAENGSKAFAPNIAKKLIWLVMIGIAISGQGTWNIVSEIQQKSHTCSSVAQ